MGTRHPSTGPQGMTCNQRVPATGGVLMLPNHISYMDALILSTAFRRPVRFVIWEPLYRIKQVTWLLKLFGTVPISPERAKDAVRNGRSMRFQTLKANWPSG